MDKGIKESDSVYRVNLSWNGDRDGDVLRDLVRGLPAGRRAARPASPAISLSDFLTNYELGWKTRWADDRFQFNGAIFLDEWDDIQISFQGENGITQVDNGPNAEITGAEVQLDWLPTDNFRLGASLAYYDTELKDDYCSTDSSDGDGDLDFDECLIDPAPSPIIDAPAGTRLAADARLQGHAHRALHVPDGRLGVVRAGLRSPTRRVPRPRSTIAEAELLGDIPSSTFLDLAYGLGNDKYNFEIFLSNATDEDAPLTVISDCSTGVCGVQPWGVMRRPRTVGLRFSQDF